MRHKKQVKTKKRLKLHPTNKTKPNTNTKTNKLRCSPNPKQVNDFTCYTEEDLHRLRDLWNVRHPDSQIETNEVHVIWNELDKKMNNICDKESCWLKQNFVNKKDKEQLLHAFAPVAPSSWKKRPNEWLSSTEIIEVMRQYEKAYKCFTFLGPSPIDYDTRKLYGQCIWQELCEFNLRSQIKEGKKKIGIIFNLDPHYLPGSHWVSMFINIKKKQIYYFDSAGAEIPDQIMKLVKDVTKQGKTLGIDFKFDQNYPVEHQYGNTECGIYALYFIVHMLEDKINNHYLKTHILKDKYIEKFRKVYFNEHKLE
jgi:hypothetical protein